VKERETISALPLRDGLAFAALMFSLALGCHRSEAPRTELPRDAEAGARSETAAPAAPLREAKTPGAADSASIAVPVPPADAEASPLAFACLEDHYAGRSVKTDAGWVLEVAGARIPYDDGRAKKTADRIASPDVEDIFALGYRSGPIVPVSDPEDDPGRVRLEPLFRATYGSKESEVSAALSNVKFAGRMVRFHRRAAPALERVAARIDALLRADPSLGRFFRELGGTFATRTIAGTDRTSAHAWGIAIDIDTSMSDYWRNSLGSGNAASKIVWRNRIPQAIVDAFEAEGFVWGGRWFHYDTMHFEYRPELFDRRCQTAR
jgi:hypothetical protein